jgi:hypothetical protein
MHSLFQHKQSSSNEVSIGRRSPSLKKISLSVNGDNICNSILNSDVNKHFSLCIPPYITSFLLSLVLYIVISFFGPGLGFRCGRFGTRKNFPLWPKFSCHPNLCFLKAFGAPEPCKYGPT